MFTPSDCPIRSRQIGSYAGPSNQRAVGATATTANIVSSIEKDPFLAAVWMVDTKSPRSPGESYRRR